MKHMIRYISCVGLGLTLGLSISLSSQENAKSYRSDFDYPLLQDVQVSSDLQVLHGNLQSKHMP